MSAQLETKRGRKAVAAKRAAAPQLTEAAPMKRPVVMPQGEREGMVLRTVYLPEAMDTELRDLAHRHRKSKNELVRAALANRIKEWRGQNSSSKIEADAQMVLEFGAAG